MFALDPDEIRGVVADGGAAAVVSGGAVGNTSSTPNTGAPGTPPEVAARFAMVKEVVQEEEQELGPRTARQPHRQPPHLQKTVAGGPHNAVVATLSACLPCAVEPALPE